jgi:hypothetical protein
MKFLMRNKLTILSNAAFLAINEHLVCPLPNIFCSFTSRWIHRMRHAIGSSESAAPVSDRRVHEYEYDLWQWARTFGQPWRTSDEGQVEAGHE